VRYFEEGDFMIFSDSQIELIKKLESGLIWDDLSASQQETLHFLQDRGVAQARVDIRDNLFCLSEYGNAVLAEHRRTQSAIAAKVRKELDDFERKELIRQEEVRSKENEKRERQQEAIQEKAERRSDQKREHRFQLFQAFLMLIVGMILEKISGIIDWLLNLFG
jgi:DNA-binding PadR family transcriptional regulator